MFSNLQEELAHALHRDLFVKKEPFARRVIIVPELRIKDYLYHFFSMHTKEKVCFGLEILTLSEAAALFIEKGQDATAFHLPSRLDFSLKIEELITKKLLEEKHNTAFSPLFHYLGPCEGVDIGSLQRKKIIALSEELARLFHKLSQEKGSIIDEWLSIGSWQQLLWKDIYLQMPLWRTPKDLLGVASSPLKQVHLFGFSSMPEVFLSLFSKTDAYYYILSPSEYFLEDLVSDKERIFLQKVLEGKKVRLKTLQQLDLYMKESNPLIGNWGKVGRELLKNTGKNEPFIEERYVAQQPDSLLSLLQNDFLFLSEGEGAHTPLRAEDDSLHLHACSSLLREVEVLAENVMRFLHDDPSLTPADITVLSPSLSSYLPLIHQVFSCLPLRYRILDTKQVDKEDPLFAYKHLLSLRDERFSLEALLELFDFLPFRQHLGWDGQKMSLIQRWLAEVTISWGYDEEQRRSLIEAGFKIPFDLSSAGCWKDGLDRLVAALIFSKEDVEDLPEGSALAEHCLDWSEADLLGQLLHTLASLADDLDLLDRFSGPLGKGCDLLREIRNRYLGEDVHCPFLKELSRLSSHYSETSAPFSLQSFHRILSFVILKKRDSFNAMDLSSVSFYSLEEGSIMPSKIICLLGMQEDSFPRSEPMSFVASLSSLKGKSSHPSKEEVDRYLFLKTILSARKKLLFSYTHISKEDSKEQNPSSCVVELFSYVHEKWPGFVPHALKTVHPAIAFHHSYFLGAGASLRNYHLAQCYYNGEKNHLPPFFSSTAASCDLPLLDGEEIPLSLEHLAKFAKHPVRFFMQHVLGIYAPSLFQREEREFVLPAYDRARLIKQSLKDPLGKVLRHTQAKGDMPLGVFEIVAQRRISEETTRREALLSDLSISPMQIGSITLASGRGEDSSVEVEGPSGSTYHLSGVIDDVCDRGLIFHGEDTYRDLVSVWPIYLVFLCAASRIPGQGKDLILTKEGKVLTFNIEDPHALVGSYLDYFMESLKAPSFLMPSWSEAILNGDEKELGKIMKKKDFIDVSPFPDDYLRWVFLRDPPPSPKDLITSYDKVAKNVFYALINREGVR